MSQKSKRRRRERARIRRVVQRGAREARRLNLDPKDVEVGYAGTIDGVTESSYAVAETGDGETLRRFATGVRFRPA